MKKNNKKKKSKKNKTNKNYRNKKRAWLWKQVKWRKPSEKLLEKQGYLAYSILSSSLQIVIIFLNQMFYAQVS